MLHATYGNLRLPPALGRSAPALTEEPSVPDHTFTRGAVRFEINIVMNVVISAPEERIFDVSCAPPPAGTITRFNPPAQSGPTFQPGYFQQAERDRLLAFAANAGETLTLDVLLTALGAACTFRTLTFDFTKIPAGWDTPVGCFDTSIRYKVHVSTWEITAKCTRNMTLGPDTFPADDTVATFRIIEPRSYQFVRRYTWNPQCCGGTARTQDEDRSDIFPRTEYSLPNHWKLGPYPDWKWKLSPLLPLPPSGGNSSGEGH
jgi:hypothetical protein